MFVTYGLLGLTFVAGFLVVFGINLLVADVRATQRKRLRKRLEEDLRLQQRERARASMQYGALYEWASEESAVLGSRPSLRVRVALVFEQAGLRITPGVILVLAVALGLVIGGGVGLLLRNLPIGAFVGLVAAALPVLYVNFRRTKRIRKLQSQLPDAFDLMSRTMRAGQTISQALQSVADDASAPLSEEFGLCYDQQNLGMSPEAAMRDLARRTGLLEVKIFVLAVMVHRQTGGNLANLLEKLSNVIRDRYRIQGVIRALTAEGRMQAIILLALPIAMLAIMLLINRPYAMVLFERPIILGVMLGSMGIGALWMRKIVNFDF